LPSMVTAPTAAAPLKACLRVRLSMLASLSSFFAIQRAFSDSAARSGARAITVI
jgi:hypothetical protein